MANRIKVRCPNFIKKALDKRHGTFLYACINNMFGAILEQETITIEVSERLFDIGPRVGENFYLRTFYLEMVVFMDAQRSTGITKVKAAENYLLYNGIDSEVLPIEAMVKAYDYHKKIKKEANEITSLF